MTTPHAPTPRGPDLPEHVDADRIGDLVDGLLEADDAAGVRSHLAACATCAAVEEDHRRVRALLRDLPPVPMPADVAARLDAALGVAARSSLGAATGAARSDQSASPPSRAPDDASGTRARPVGSTVTPIGAARRSRLRVSTAVLQVAAAIVLLAAVGALVVGALNSGEVDGSATPTGSEAVGGAAARAPGGTIETMYTASGRNYTAGSLAQQGELLLSGDAPGARLYLGTEAGAPTVAGDAGGGLGEGSTGGTPSATGSGPAQAPTSASASAPAQRAVDACVTALGGGRPARAVDVARYEGKPALVVVFTREGRSGAEVWVVGSGCRPGDEQVLQVAFTDG